MELPERCLDANIWIGGFDLSNQNVFECGQEQDDEVDLLLERGWRVVLVCDVNHDAGERVGRQARASTIRDANVELKFVLIFKVERGDGSNGSGRLVDGEILLGLLLEDVKGQERVDSAVGVRRADHQRTKILFEKHERADGSRLADVADEVGLLKLGLVVVDV